MEPSTSNLGRRNRWRRIQAPCRSCSSPDPATLYQIWHGEKGAMQDSSRWRCSCPRRIRSRPCSHRSSDNIGRKTPFPFPFRTGKPSSHVLYHFWIFLKIRKQTGQMWKNERFAMGKIPFVFNANEIYASTVSNLPSEQLVNFFFLPLIKTANQLFISLRCYNIIVYIRWSYIC